jgi:hypothetical protein
MIINGAVSHSASFLGDTPVMARRGQEAVRLGFEWSSSRGQRRRRFERWFSRYRSLAVFDACFPSEEVKRHVPSREKHALRLGGLPPLRSPNKAPEPTTTAVTPRAT